MSSSPPPQPLISPWKEGEELTRYIIDDKCVKLTVGELYNATKVGSARTFKVKKIANTPTNKSFIEKEEENMKKAIHPALAKMVSVIKEESYVYHIFEGFKGKNLQDTLIKEKELFEEEQASYISIQFLNFIDGIHKTGVHYCRPTVDNVFFNKKNVLKIYGLDADSDGFPSYISLADNPITDATDHLCLAEFITLILTGKTVNDKGLSLPDPINTLVNNLSDKSLAVRQNFNPRKTDFLTPKICAKFNEEKCSLQIDQFKVNWKKGILIGYGKTMVGWQSGFVFESSGDSMKINGSGLKYESEDFDFSIGAQGLKMSGEKNEDEQKRTILSIGGNGFTCKIGTDTSFEKSVTIGPDGLSYVAEEQIFSIGKKGIKCTFRDTKGMKQGMEGGNYTVNINDFFVLKLGKSGLYLKIGTAVLSINREGIIIDMAHVQLTLLLSGNIEILMGGLNFNLGIDGLNLTMGTFIFNIKSTMTLECEGFRLLVDDEGCHIENDNAPFNFAQYTANIPRIDMSAAFSTLSLPIPKIPIPKLPELPELPELSSCDCYDIFTRKDPVGEEKELNDVVPENQIILSTIVNKKRFLSRKTRRIVLTKAHKIEYYTPKYEYKRGEIILCKDSQLKVEDEEYLGVVGENGRTYNLIFYQGDRTQWIEALQQEIVLLRLHSTEKSTLENPLI